jgi:hypothetical protein
MTRSHIPLVQAVTEPKRQTRTILRYPRATTGDQAMVYVLKLWAQDQWT